MLPEKNKVCSVSAGSDGSGQPATCPTRSLPTAILKSQASACWLIFHTLRMSVGLSDSLCSHPGFRIASKNGVETAFWLEVAIGSSLEGGPCFVGVVMSTGFCFGAATTEPEGNTAL